MEELSDRSELSRLRKEQERERRRLRDRQRRQSMSLEEREKHLARRRRNYQLRRQRAESARLDPHIQLAVNGEMLNGHDHQVLNFVSNINTECNGGLPVGSEQGNEIEFTKSHSLEVPAHKMPKFPGRLRLNRLKHLARTINDPRDEPVDDHRITTDSMAKMDVSPNCISSNGLRLNRVKRIARTLNSTIKENPHRGLDQSKIEG